MIWECRVSDGIIRYFESRVEADFFANDTKSAGFTVITQPIACPKTPREFVNFMEAVFASYRRVIIAAHQAVGGEP